MYRNAESRFALNMPTVSMPRSKFVRPQSHKTTFNAGQLIPFYIDEVLPGDTHQIDTSFLIRTQPLVAPIMDNMWMDTFFFFVPMRLTWDHAPEFFGENTESAWIPQSEYTIPQITSPASTGWTCGSIADYMGIPTGVTGLSVNALPFRAYALICNEFFRDENLTDPLNIPTNDSTQTGTNGTSYINDVANGGAPFVAAKYHDYFSSALPAPQKGPDVEINLAALSGSIPVVGNGYNLALTDGTNKVGAYTSNSVVTFGPTAYAVETPTYQGGTGTALSNAKGVGVPTASQLGDHPEYSGLEGSLAGISGETIMTIAQLRQAFAIQRFYEANARGGSRYIEILKQHFGVTSPDSRLQRPEYLGGDHVLININQVIQTSETTQTGALGDQAAYSLTTDSHSDFTHSFVEHGFIIGLACVRYEESYQQGIERMWSRKSKFDYYWPILANISEQSIKNKEIYAQGSSVINASTGVAYDEEVFGYQEAWAEYRYKPNRISGEMRSTYTAPLDMWHLADYYTQLPALSDGWIREDQSNIDRALAVTSQISAQFFGDFYVKDISSRCMPVYSIPGLSRL